MPKKSNATRADGRIGVRVYLGIVDGKKKYKYCYGKTQKEADAKADAVRAKLKKGMDITHDKDSFGEWCDRWLALKKSDIGNSQYQSYVGYIKHLKANLDKTPLRNITTYDLQLMINELSEYNPNTGRPTAKKTLTDIKNTAVQVLQLAVENRVLDYNPAVAVRVPKNAPSASRRALTEEEQEIIRTTPHRMQTAAMIMMYAGLRRGELIPLTWSDIDLKKATISVNKAADVSDNGAKIKKTKTKAGIRTVNIPQILVDYLSETPKNSILVCPTVNGGMHSATSWRAAWNSYLLDLDVLYGKRPQKRSKYDKRFPGITIDRITPHMLRHTFCTNLYTAGISQMTVKNQMGHSDVRTTLQVYTHPDADYDEKEMQKLNAYFNKCGSNVGQGKTGSVDK